MKRRYVVEQYTGGTPKPVTSTSYQDPEEALDNFSTLLHVAGHTTDKVNLILHQFTVILMMGGFGFSAPDPDFNGSVEIMVKEK